jgi:phage baseplate assembly protein W
MSDKLFFKDIKLTNRGFDVHTSDREGVSLVATLQSDVATVSGRDNLAQAVVNRLLTRKGELTSLGHPDYGSRLYELIGEPNNIRLQGLAEIYIRESLQAETRIEDIRSIAFALPDRKQGRSELRIMIHIKPVGDAAEFSIVLPINL